MRKSYCILFLLLCLGEMKAQDEIIPNIFQEEKISLMMGLGFDYGLLGFRGKYSLHKNVKAVGSIGIPTTLFWNLGLEANLDSSLSDVFSPYLTVFYGVNAYIELESHSGLLEKMNLLGPTFGIGVKLNLVKKLRSYLTIGFNYRIIGPGKRAKENEFNATYGTNHNIVYNRKFYPSFGWTLRIWE